MQTPIRRRKLYEDVALRIEEMIREGRYALGDQLPAEREIMEELGVGRSAVREAMLALQRMGLVTVSSGERARVTAPTAKVLVSELAGAARLLLAQDGGVRRFQEARALFEVGLARAAAQHASEADLARLRTALEANRAAIGDHADFMRTDVAFHYVLAVIPRNPIFPAIHAAIVEWLVQQRHITLTWSGRSGAEGAYQAHKAIHEAIAARDPDRAEKAMRDHLAEVASLFWKAMESDA